MANAYDVADLAGVSIGTVSRYLSGNGYVGKQSRAKISNAIETLGFIPNRAAASLTTKATRLIGFVASDLRNPFTTEVASSLGRHARAKGYTMVIAESMESPEAAVEAIGLLRQHGVDGLIVTPPESDQLNSTLVAAAKALPIVGIGLRTDPVVTDRVTSDTQAGAREATEHLLELGHHRVAYIGSPTMASGRRRGYTQALQHANLEVDPTVMFDHGLNREAGAAALDEALDLKDPPTAVLAANDAVALGVLQRAYERDIRVPQELSVVGFDDVDLAQHSVPPLTTVAQPMADMGRAAIDLLAARLTTDRTAEPQTVELTSELVIRSSTGPYSA